MKSYPFMPFFFWSPVRPLRFYVNTVLGNFWLFILCIDMDFYQKLHRDCGDVKKKMLMLVS